MLSTVLIMHCSIVR